MRPRALLGVAGAAVLALAALAVVIVTDEPSASPDLAAPGGAQATPEATPSLPDRPATIEFLLVGDPGEGGDREAATSDAARGLAPSHDLLVTTGDNVASRLGTEELRRNYLERWGWAREQDVPVVAALGDNDAPRAELVRELTGAPAGWFAHRAGPLELFVLDTNQPRSERQQAWFEQALAASTAPWQVVVLHEPPFSCSPSQGRRAVRTDWVPRFEEYGVDLVLAGHHHSYQRFEPLDGVTYVITSGSGARAHPVDETQCPASPAVVAHDHEHLKLYRGKVTVEEFTLEVLDVESGEILDRLRLGR